MTARYALERPGARRASRTGPTRAGREVEPRWPPTPSPGTPPINSRKRSPTTAPKTTRTTARALRGQPPDILDGPDRPRCAAVRAVRRCLRGTRWLRVDPTGVERWAIQRHLRGTGRATPEPKSFVRRASQRCKHRRLDTASSPVYVRTPADFRHQRHMGRPRKLHDVLQIRGHPRGDDGF